jgi:D-alanyl-D-alanine carboxypeptidase
MEDGAAPINIKHARKALMRVPSQARVTAVLFLCLLALFAYGCSNDGSPDLPPPLPVAALQSMLNSRVAASTHVPGALLAVSRDKTQWIGVAGESDTSTHAVMEPTLRFRVGSLTKQFTAALILKLVEEGKLSLEDTLQQWLPHLHVPYDDRITLRMLLNHTSGVPNYATRNFWDNLVFPNPDRAWQPAELVQFALAGTSSEPGTIFAYCNTGYILAGMIAEAAARERASDAMAHRFFIPLGMDDTELAMNAVLGGPYAHGYLQLPESPSVDDVSGWNPSHAWTAGSVVSTARDLLIWAKALFGGRVLSPASLDAMIIPMAPSTVYGMGLEKGVAADSRTFVYHTGLIPGYSSMIAHHRESGLTILVLTNREDISVETNDVVTPLFEGAAALLP